MPVACPLSLTRRAYTASVIHNAFRLTELSSFPLVQSRLTHSVPSLKSALVSASKKHVAPNLHVDSDDISFVPLRHWQTWQAFSGHQQDDDAANPELASRENESDSNLTATRALQELLARRVTLSAESTEHEHIQHQDLTSAEEQSLASVQATRLDLDRWLEILTTRDSLRAARLLTQASPPPSFVFLYTLRRHHICPDALRLLIRHLPTWYKATHKETKHNTRASSVRIDAFLQVPVFRAFLRLLRHCQRVWPQALESLSIFLTTHLRLSAAAKTDLGIVQVSRLTFLYNRALYLVANPAHVGPFKNIVHQEAAQAILIRFMAEHNPPLVINREGYRGVVRVQLASMKTPSEQEWARLKSPSWPPWKEDRTGMDSHIGLDYGVSRARHVLNRMQEAGYSLQHWDRVALIYTGWDTDFSPTIQTRVSLRDQSRSRTPDFVYFWVARIRTTRTAQQAWACFLAYQDEKLPPSPLVYHAMFHVLVQERKRLRLGSRNIGHEVDQTDTDPLYPGDTREIGSPPSSSHQLTYVRVDIPSVQQLFHHMQEEHLAPSGVTLALLLHSAENVDEGTMYLKSAAEKYQDAIGALFSENIDRDHLSSLPDAVFNAYVGLLCRFPHTPLNKLELNKFKYANWGLRLDQPLFRALYLLVVSKRQHRPSWNNILRCLARRESPVVSSSWRRVHLENVDLNPEQDMYDRVFAYNLARQNIATMQEADLTLDIEAFRYFCIIVEHAANASNSILQRYGIAPEEATDVVDARHITRAKEMLQDTPYVRGQFWKLVKGRIDTEAELCTESTEEMELPSLLSAPGPAILHAYIRALGFMHDYDGLEELLRWMHQFHDELAGRRAEDRNGAVVMRRALTALRVFMEGAWRDRPTSTNDDSEDEIPEPRGAPRQQIEEMARLVDDIEDWGGWPSDDEVEVYLEKANQ